MEKITIDIDTQLRYKQNYEIVESEITEKMKAYLYPIQKYLSYNDAEVDDDIWETLEIGIVTSIMKTIKQNLITAQDSIEKEELEIEEEDNDTYYKDYADTVNFEWNRAKGIS